MRVVSVVVLLWLCLAGCARDRPAPPAPKTDSVAGQPNASPPAAKPVVEPPVAKAAPLAKAAALPPAAKAAAKPRTKTPTLDLTTLTTQLRETKAIGFFTKIALKNQVDDLLDQFREYHQGRAKRTMVDLRRSYELLMMKVLTLLQDADEALASAIVSSREAIWGMLADPKKFATLQG